MIATAGLSQSLSTVIGGSDSGLDKTPAEHSVAVDHELLESTYLVWIARLDEFEEGIATLERTGGHHQQTSRRFVLNIRKIIEQAEASRAEADAALSIPLEALDAIGPIPAMGEPPEAAIIAEYREKHQQDIARLSAQMTFARLTKANADRLIARLTLITKARLTEWLFLRDGPDFGKGGFGPRVMSMIRSVRRPDLNQKFGISEPWVAAGAMLSAILACGLLVWVRLTAPLGRPGVVRLDARGRAVHRLARATYLGLAPAALSLSLAIVLLTVPTFGAVAWPTLVASGTVGVALFLWLYQVCHVAISPSNAAFRVPELTDASARRLDNILLVFSAIMAIFTTFYLVVTLAGSKDDTLITLLKFLATLCIAIFAFAALRKPIATHDDPEKGSNRQRVARMGLITISGAALVAAAVGFVNFSVFMTTNIAGSILLAFATYFIRPVLHDGLQAIYTGSGGSFSIDRRSLAETVAHFLLDLAVLISFAILSLGLWGAPLNLIWLWLGQTSSNISIGTFTLGIGDIAFAVAVFAVVYALSRLVLRIIRRVGLARRSIDQGIQNSIETALGYLGFIIAVLAAVAALGFNFTNFALIFGALSLGAGLGLRKTVENFVSGLILLIQRPIKVGDWIQMEDNEGVVKRIGVLSTEMTTFEEASAVIPNSNLISSVVLNRTLGMSRGRVDVAISVAYGSDIGTVFEILHKCASANETVLEAPEPSVILLEFGDSGLGFVLRAFIPDIRDIYTVATELRVAVLEEFRAQGITIPFPQHDLHLRTRPDDSRTSTCVDQEDSTDAVAKSNS